MKSFKSVLLLILICPGPIFLKAQQIPQIPENADMRTKADFEAAEQLVLESSNWLTQTDLDKYTQDRKQVNEFVWKWVSGTPALTIDITDELTKLYENNIQLLNIFLAAYSSYYIRHKTDFTNLSASREGIHAMILVYNKGIEIKKNKYLEKISHLPPAELEAYISARFK